MKRNLRFIGVAAAVAAVVAACTPKPPQNTSIGTLQLSSYQVRAENSVRTSTTTASLFLPATGFPEAAMWEEGWWPNWTVSPDYWSSPSFDPDCAWGPGYSSNEVDCYETTDAADVYPVIGFALFPYATTYYEGLGSGDFDTMRFGQTQWPARGSSRVYGTPGTPLQFDDDDVLELFFGGFGSGGEWEQLYKYSSCNQFVEAFGYAADFWGWDGFPSVAGDIPFANVYVPRDRYGDPASLVEAPGFGMNLASPSPSASASMANMGTAAPAGSMFRMDLPITIGAVPDTTIFRLVAMHGRWVDVDGDGYPEAGDTMVCDGTIASTITARGSSGFPQDPDAWDWFEGFCSPAVTPKGGVCNGVDMIEDYIAD